ncbi:MAG TPA: DUF4097 family beta strand repeat-containing protein [Bryobacteraceae bacterium]|nr:DUF4097 family beta strand repeat-containing protein [Bryobacteraceae bacterium]
MRLLILAAATTFLGGCALIDMGSSDRYQSDFHYTYDLQPDGHVSAETFNGSIDIEGWDQNKVEISGTKYGNSEALRDHVTVEINHTTASIDIRAARGGSHEGSSGARFTLRVPRGAIVDRVTSSNGHIKIRDVARAARLVTSNASITATRLEGDVDAHTSNGSIEIEGVKGGATLKSSNGRIEMESVGGPLDAETSNNSITARLDSAPSAATRLLTSNGSIDLTLGASPKADIRAETRNNGITLHLPPGVGAHLVAQTTNGSITSEFDLTSKGEEEKHHVDGVIGGGGPRIDLNTTNGKIRVVKTSGN